MGPIFDRFEHFGGEFRTYSAAAQGRRDLDMGEDHAIPLPVIGNEGVGWNHGTNKPPCTLIMQKAGIIKVRTRQLLVQFCKGWIA